MLENEIDNAALSPIQAAYELACKELSVNEELLAQLCARLEPVCAPWHPAEVSESSSKASPEPPSSQLTCQFRYITAELHKRNDLLRQLMENFEV